MIFPNSFLLSSTPEKVEQTFRNNLGSVDAEFLWKIQKVVF